MNRQPSQTAIAELICTRISHDIIGNIGAVANAVELLEEGDLDFLDDIKSILKVSSGVLSARLKFFRMTFGLENANLANPDQVAKACREYLATLGNKNYPIELQIEISNPDFCRPTLLGVMILADTIVKGGWLKVEEKENQLYIVSYSNNEVSKDKIAGIKGALSASSAAEATAQLAPVFYLKEILTFANYKLSFVDDRLLGFVIG